MAGNYELHEDILVDRYSSREMARLWGPQRRYSTWRRLWVALAEAEAELGLEISPEQIAELRAHVDDIDFPRAAELEKSLRHDVMAHVHLLGELCPKAKPIIHLGATSCYVTDNTDLILLREALGMLAKQLAAVIDALSAFAVQYADLPCLGFTHFQPAQLTTVGKRASLWCYDLVLDLAEVEHRIGTLLCRGVKGTTGTQASFLELFNGDHAKVEQLDHLVSKKIGFAKSYPVTGQTYTRKTDAQILSTLAGLGASCHKLGTDLRLLANKKEIEEPFETHQIGSSAMPYKRNPMRSERMCALGRFLMGLQDNAYQTHAVQWLERTLDDSANRRLVLPQAFLTADACLRLCLNIVRGLVVYPSVIAKNIGEELPFMASERILMQAVTKGGDRQDLHERIRQHSIAAAAQVKQHGKPNDMLDRLRRDPAFAAVDLDEALAPAAFIGRAPEQVKQFAADCVEPIRERWFGAGAAADSTIEV